MTENFRRSARKFCSIAGTFRNVLFSSRSMKIFITVRIQKTEIITNNNECFLLFIIEMFIKTNEKYVHRIRPNNFLYISHSLPALSLYFLLK